VVRGVCDSFFPRPLKKRTEKSMLAIRLAIPVLACVAAQQPDCSVGTGECDDEHDANALLSLRATHWRSENKVRRAVCRGSGQSCEGNQCCDGVPETGNMTFPCPTADPDFYECQVDMALCPGTMKRCVGNECCPRYDGSDNKTFPCPAADPEWDGCETGIKEPTPEPTPVEPTLEPTPEPTLAPTLALTPAPTPETTDPDSEASTCPGSNQSCKGNQCCLGIAATDFKTFPCPAAEPTYECEIDYAKCPGTGNHCVGNQCCAAHEGSDGQATPCPVADPDWNECR